MAVRSGWPQATVVRRLRVVSHGKGESQWRRGVAPLTVQRVGSTGRFREQSHESHGVPEVIGNRFHGTTRGQRVASGQRQVQRRVCAVCGIPCARRLRAYPHGRHNTPVPAGANRGFQQCRAACDPMRRMRLGRVRRRPCIDDAWPWRTRRDPVARQAWFRQVSIGTHIRSAGVDGMVVACNIPMNTTRRPALWWARKSCTECAGLPRA